MPYDRNIKTAFFVKIERLIYINKNKNKNQIDTESRRYNSVC